MSEIASLSLEIDSFAAVKAKEDQDALTESGKKLEKQYEGITQAQVNANYASYKAAQAFMNQRVAVEGASAEVQKILGRYDPLGAKLRQLQTDFNSLDKAIQAGATGGTSDAALDKTMKALNDEIAKTKGLMVAAGAGTEQTGTSMRGLGLHTAMARRELMILGREAMTGHFAQMPQTFLQLVAHSNLLSVLLNPITLGVIGLAGAAGIMAVAFFKGSHEAREMNNALQLTSSYAGVTRGQMLGLAEAMTQVGAVTVGTAKGIVTALVTSGQIGAQAIGAVARLASDYAAATGKDLDKLAPELTKLFADPAKGAEELNKQMHFLLPSEIEHIAHLERIGRLGEAQLILAQRLAAHIPQEVKQLGILETAWDGVRKGASSAWDAMLSVGRQTTLEEQLAEATADLAALQSLGGRGARPASIAAVQRRVDLLTPQVAAAQAAAAQAASEADANAAANKAAALIKQVSEYAKIKVLQDEIALIQRSAPDDADRARAVLVLSRQIRDIRSGMGAEERALAEARAAGELKAFEVEQKSAAERTLSLVKLGVITAEQGEERRLAIDLETIAAKKSSAERVLALVGLTELERQRQVEAMRGFDAEALARRAAFDDAKKLSDVLRLNLQARMDAGAAGDRTRRQLSDISALDSEIIKLRERAKAIGLNSAQVAALQAAERDRAIAFLQFDIGASELGEDDPDVIRLQMQIDKLKELRDLERATASAEAGAGIAQSLRNPVEAENEAYAIRAANLETFLQTTTGQIADAQAMREALEIQHRQNILAIELSKNQEIQQMQMGTWALAAQLLQEFAGKSKAAAIAVIAIEKGLAIARTIQNTAAATMAAEYWGWLTGGWAGAAAAVAQVQAMGALQVALIAATGLVQAAGVGRSDTSASSGASTGGAVPTFNANPVTGVPDTRRGQTTVYHLYGGPSQTYTRAQVRELLEKQNENFVDGSRNVVVEHS